jgi:hypothetical protein
LAFPLGSGEHRGCRSFTNISLPGGVRPEGSTGTVGYFAGTAPIDSNLRRFQMAIQIGKALAFTAVGGMVAGLAGCGGAAAADGAAAAKSPEAAGAAAAAVGAKDCCKGKNECKGKGNCKNDKNDCKGKNECKGTGGCKAADCK